MNINELTKEIHQNAVDHGWWDKPRSFGEIIALCHSELSEALEAHRSPDGPIYYKCTRCQALGCHQADMATGESQSTSRKGAEGRGKEKGKADGQDAVDIRPQGTEEIYDLEGKRG